MKRLKRLKKPLEDDAETSKTFEWHKMFIGGRASINDDFPRGPSTSDFNECGSAAENVIIAKK